MKIRLLEFLLVVASTGITGYISAFLDHHTFWIVLAALWLFGLGVHFWARRGMSQLANARTQEKACYLRKV